MNIRRLSVFLAISLRTSGVAGWRNKWGPSSQRLFRQSLFTQQYLGFAPIIPKVVEEKDELEISNSQAKFEEKDPGEVTGTSLRVLKYPHPKLRQENEIISVFDDALKQLAEEMLLVMYAAEGVGLAAPQVGINKRLMVFNEDGDPLAKEKEMILVNPVITATSDTMIVDEEGCLSFPEINGEVARYEWIEVDYQTIDGRSVKGKVFEGLNSIIFQHEYDHLDKILFIDRFNRSDKKVNKKQLIKLINNYGPGGGYHTSIEGGRLNSKSFKAIMLSLYTKNKKSNKQITGLPASWAAIR